MGGQFNECEKIQKRRHSHRSYASGGGLFDGYGGRYRCYERWDGANAGFATTFTCP